VRFLPSAGLGACGFAVATMFPMGCIFEAWGEDSENCPTQRATLEDGELAQGTDPAAVTAPLFRIHSGSLEWTLAGRSTPVALEVRRTAPFEEVLDCNGKFVRFDTNAEWRLSTEDGLIDETLSSHVAFSRVGVLEESRTLRYAPAFDTLRTGGVTNPNMIAGYAIRLVVHIDPETLAPSDTVVYVTSSRDPEPIGRISFGD
jgi:hypothetical protein